MSWVFVFLAGVWGGGINCQNNVLVWNKTDIKLNRTLFFAYGQDKDETETVKQVQESETYNGSEIPQSMKSDASDQEEDEESEGCPVSISK